MEKNRTVEEMVEKINAITPGEKLILLRKLQHPSNPAEQEEIERKFWASYGGWKGDGTAEELIASIYNSRTAAPEREAFD